MTLPGGMKLSTGVMVLYADDESFTLMTPQGHMFAGWITFSATERDDETVAQAQVLMRASDPIFELGLMLGGHRQEDKFWSQHAGQPGGATSATDAEVDTEVVCVDKRRQWSRWTNVWHSSAIRSTIYTLGAPWRGARALAHRGTPSAESTHGYAAIATSDHACVKPTGLVPERGPVPAKTPSTVFQRQGSFSSLCVPSAPYEGTCRGGSRCTPTGMTPSIHSPTS